MADTPDAEAAGPADQPDIAGEQPSADSSAAAESSIDTEALASVAEPAELPASVPGSEVAATRSTWQGWRPYATLGAIAAVYAGAFGLAGGLGWQLWNHHVIDRAGQTAQQTAIDYAQVLTSISSDEVDDNFAAVLNGATGDFKDMYTKSSMELRQLLIDKRSAAQGLVVDSAIQSKSTDRVVLLLMVDQKVTNTEMPDPRVDRTRMKMTMDHVEGRWLASKVELP